MKTLLTMLLMLWALPARSEPMDDLLQQAQREALPVEPLRTKTQEGQAKRVPAARVRQVVARLLSELRQARAWLVREKGAAPARLLVAVAEARLAGVAQKDVAAVLQPKVSELDVRRVDALMDLQLRGYPADQSVRLVRAAALNQLALLGRSLDRLQADTGRTPEEVADALLRGVQANQGNVAGAVRILRGAPMQPPKSLNPAPRGWWKGKGHGKSKPPKPDNDGTAAPGKGTN